MAQAVAITTEDGVIALLKRLSGWTEEDESTGGVLRSLAHGFGYLWVLAWFSFALRLWGANAPDQTIWKWHLVPSLGLGDAIVARIISA